MRNYAFPRTISSSGARPLSTSVASHFTLGALEAKSRETTPSALEAKLQGFSYLYTIMESHVNVVLNEEIQISTFLRGICTTQGH